MALRLPSPPLLGHIGPLYSSLHHLTTLSVADERTSTRRATPPPLRHLLAGDRVYSYCLFSMMAVQNAARCLCTRSHRSWHGSISHGAAQAPHVQPTSPSVVVCCLCYHQWCVRSVGRWPGMKGKWLRAATKHPAACAAARNTRRRSGGPRPAGRRPAAAGRARCDAPADEMKSWRTAAQPCVISVVPSVVFVACRPLVSHLTTTYGAYVQQKNQSSPPPVSRHASIEAREA